MAKIKTATINGVKYDIDITGAIDGSCDYPRGGRPSIRICVDDINTLRGLETLIHEILHAVCWAKTEELTGKAAHDLARLIWRIGFRIEDGNV